MGNLPRFKAAAVHAAPVFLDKAATTEKAVSILREAARSGAEFIAFPETYIPAFPVWAATGAPIAKPRPVRANGGESVLFDGPEVDRLRHEVRELGVFLSIGMSERSAVSLGGLWNTNIIIGDDGRILVHHRKLVPTFYEKLIWAAGRRRWASGGRHADRSPRRLDLRRESRTRSPVSP
jgi:aliphatic nitrilase